MSAGEHALYQPFPPSGLLRGNINLDVDQLIQRLGTGRGEVYCYVVATVRYEDGQFVQTGSAPNFQGGLITLCTCKHQMRAGKPADAWPDIWIAGVTGISESPDGRNRLFYLMRVESTFESQRALWAWLHQNASNAAQAKRSDKNRLSDVYVPTSDSGDQCDPFDPKTYIPPCLDHIHQPTAWREDIDYSKGRRAPALLVGDPAYSFLWSSPVIPISPRVPRGSRKQQLADLLDFRER